MRFSFRPSPGTVLGFIALMVALGGTALAATGQLVNIADPSNAARMAKVDSSGKLSVGDGSGPMTVDGNVLAREAAPTTWFRAYGFSDGTCVPVYQPPSGKAAVVKTLVTNVLNVSSPGNGTYVGYYVSATPCSTSYAYDINPATVGVTTLPLDPGLVIPAGSTLYVEASNVSAEAEPSGYTLPGTSVSAAAARTSRAGSALAQQAR